MSFGFSPAPRGDDPVSIQAICELLRAVQNSDDSVRQEAEKKLEEAWEQQPNALVQQLVAVLSARETGGAAVELRQEAAVLLKHSAAGGGTHRRLWEDLDAQVKELMKAQLLAAVAHDSSTPVRRNAASAAAAIADFVADNLEELAKEWPQLLPALEGFVRPDSAPTTRVAALGLLEELTATVGEGLVAQGAQVTSMLQCCLSDAHAGVRAGGAQLMLQMVEDLDKEAWAVLGQVMPGVTGAICSFGQSTEHEDLLRDTLESLISAADEEPEFFKDHDFQNLWPLLLQLCGAQHFSDDDVRHSAMEAAMSIIVGNCEDFCKPEGQPFLEQIIALNIEWMFEVEEDVDLWTKQADEPEEDDEIDGDTVQLGEENLDRLAEKSADASLCEDVFMPALFKAIRTMLGASAVSWKHNRAAVMAVSQVVEHIEEEAWIDQCVTFIGQQLGHAHPRVRYSGFQAVGQVAYDHEPYVQGSHSELLLSAIATGLDDANIRVAANAANAFVSLGEELDRDDLEPYLDDIMTKLFTRLQQGQTRTMQEQCLAGIAVIGDVAEELFAPYYMHVMPVLKQIIAKASGENERTLRGKAFECVSLIGDAVGKDMFLADAREVMQTMTSAIQAGFSADDTTREYIHEAAGRIATTLKRDFKPYVPALLPSIFNVLAQRPTEVDPALADLDEDDEKEDMSLLMVGEKVLGLKTAVLDEMQEALSLVGTLIEALQDDYCDFLATTCQALGPLLDFPLSHGLREAAFKTWEHLAECTRNGVEAGKCDRGSLGELVQKFLAATLTLMAKCPKGDALDEGALGALQAEATGIGGVIRKAGPGVLSKQDVEGLVKVLMELLERVSSDDQPADMSLARKRRGSPIAAGVDDDEDSDDDSDDEPVATRQSVRYCVVDVAGALMRTNRTEFAEVGLQTFMELVQRLLQPNVPDAERSLALYLAEDVVEYLAELSVPFWSLFMEQACHAVVDRCPAVRQYACGTVGAGARLPAFAPAARAAAGQLGRLIQKHGERHRRRRAGTQEAKQVALATDSAIRALGTLIRHQEVALGADSAQAWGLWLSNLPLRYDTDEGQKAHQQLLELVVESHGFITSPENLPRVLGVFADIYRTKFSTSSLDKGIAAAVHKAGAERTKQFASGLPEKQQKKVEQMLKDGGQAQ